MEHLVNSELKQITADHEKIVLDLQKEWFTNDNRLSEIEDDIYDLEQEQKKIERQIQLLEPKIEKAKEKLKTFQDEVDRRNELGILIFSQSELEVFGQKTLFND